MEHDQRREEFTRVAQQLSRIQRDPSASPHNDFLFSLVSNALPDALIITDHDYKILFVNPATEALFGYTTDELITASLSALFPDDRWQQFHDFCQARSAHPEPMSTNCIQHVTVLTHRGLEITTQVYLSIATFDNADIYAILFRQIARQKRTAEGPQQLDDQRRHAQRLQSIGRLTAGLAHEYNNLLTAIVGYSDILLMRLNQEDVLSRYVGHINTASTRAAALTRHLLAFSRHQSHAPELCELNTIITDMDKMIRALLDEDIEFSVNLASDLGIVCIDLGEFLQIFIIILLTIRRYLTKGTHVFIETANTQTTGDTKHELVDAPAGSYVMLAIGYHSPASDQQPLDPPSVLALSDDDLGPDWQAVLEILQNVGGEISVTAPTPHQKTYNLYLPRFVEPRNASKPGRATQSSVLEPETILVVDDEEMIRALMREALRMTGYHVLEASHAMQAIRLAEQHENPIHLLVTDVVMPGMNGRELAGHLMAQRPELRILFISGHSAQLLTRNGIDCTDGRFLQKPFSTSTLIQKVRLTLDAKQTNHTPG